MKNRKKTKIIYLQVGVDIFSFKPIIVKHYI